GRLGGVGALADEWRRVRRPQGAELERRPVAVEQDGAVVADDAGRAHAEQVQSALPARVREQVLVDRVATEARRALQDDRGERAAAGALRPAARATGLAGQEKEGAG